MKAKFMNLMTLPVPVSNLLHNREIDTQFFFASLPKTSNRLQRSTGIAQAKNLSMQQANPAVFTDYLNVEAKPNHNNK